MKSSVQPGAERIPTRSPPEMLPYYRKIDSITSWQTVKREGNDNTEYHEPEARSFTGSGGEGFTLIGLIVVIKIVAALASKLLPTFARAKEKGRQAHCIGSLRKVGIGTTMYADDFRGAFHHGESAFTGPRRCVEGADLRTIGFDDLAFRRLEAA